MNCVVSAMRNSINVARKPMDTSAVMKLYLAEPNSPQVRACLAVEDELILLELVSIEIVSAAYGLVRQGKATVAEADALIAAYEKDKAGYILIPFREEIRTEADRLLRTYAATVSLRPMDAFQLANVLLEHRRKPVDAFIVTDNVLRNVAQAEGLTVKP
jgi:predicted nucleic acid-binding protein